MIYDYCLFVCLFVCLTYLKYAKTLLIWFAQLIQKVHGIQDLLNSRVLSMHQSIDVPCIDSQCLWTWCSNCQCTNESDRSIKSLLVHRRECRLLEGWCIEYYLYLYIWVLYMYIVYIYIITLAITITIIKINILYI